MQAMLAYPRRSGMVRLRKFAGGTFATGAQAGVQVGLDVGLQVGFRVNTPIHRWSRLAVAAAMMAALGLAACGRKGGLDPPPTAGLTTPSSYTSRPSIGEETASLAPRPTDEHPPARPQGVAPATVPPPPKKTFFLDFLLAK